MLRALACSCSLPTIPLAQSKTDRLIENVDWARDMQWQGGKRFAGSVAAEPLGSVDELINGFFCVQAIKLRVSCMLTSNLRTRHHHTASPSCEIDPQRNP
jgi:hypothetical protein